MISRGVRYHISTLIYMYSNSTNDLQHFKSKRDQFTKFQSNSTHFKLLDEADLARFEADLGGHLGVPAAEVHAGDGRVATLQRLQQGVVHKDVLLLWEKGQGIFYWDS